MPDTDDLLEAEKAIQKVAAELKRMKTAADLLQSAQEKTDAVLGSAEQIMRTVEEFNSACSKIVKKLSETDLNRRFDELQTTAKQIEPQIKNLQDKYLEMAKESKTRQTITNRRFDELQATAKQIESHIKNLQDRYLEMAKESKTRQTIIMGFAVSTFLAVLAILAIMLMGEFNQ